MKWSFFSAVTMAIGVSLQIFTPLHAVVEQAEETSLLIQTVNFPQIPEFYTAGATSPQLQVVLLHNDQIRWQQQLAVYEAIRVELFDPDSGAFESHQQLQRKLPELTLKVPVDLDITHAEFYLITEQDRPQLLATQTAWSLWLEQLALMSGSGDPLLQQALSFASITSILENGPSSNRLDLVLLGDGYTADEMDKWQQDAMTVALGFLSEPPYDSYHSYFNVHRIDVASNESGVSRAKGIQRDTAFGTFYNCADIQRLICGNDQLVNQVLEQLTTQEQRDIVVVIVNDAEYGGSGGMHAYASMNSLAIELVLHETGHSFGKLADEYDATGADNPACNIGSAFEANVSPLVSREALKWRHWVDQTTAVPTTNERPSLSSGSTPGLYRGSKYCNELYRPTPNSKMRSLGRPFDAINEEALVLRMYSFVSPIDAVFPPTERVQVNGAIPGNFLMKMPTPVFHSLMLQWYVGDQLIQTGGELDPDKLPLGRSLVSARVYDPIAKVRRDDVGWLAGEHTWTVDKSGSGQPITAVFDGTSSTLFIPAVYLPEDNTLFQVQLRMISDSPIRLMLTEAYALDGKLESPSMPRFSGDTLRVDRLEYYGEMYKAEFTLIDATSMTFELTSAEPVP